MIRVRVRVRVKLGVGLGLGFRSGQSQCVPLFRSVNYHILVKSGTRRSRSVPPFRSGKYTNPSPLYRVRSFAGGVLSRSR